MAAAEKPEQSKLNLKNKCDENFKFKDNFL